MTAPVPADGGAATGGLGEDEATIRAAIERAVEDFWQGYDGRPHTFEDFVREGLPSRLATLLARVRAEERERGAPARFAAYEALVHAPRTYRVNAALDAIDRYTRESP